MVQLKELLIVGSLTFAVGGVASLAGGANGALVGGTTAAVLGVSLVTQRQNNKIARLEAEINKQQDWEKINAKLPSFKVELQRRQEDLQRLEKEKKELSPIEGQLTEKKTQLQQVENRLTELTQQKQELENRVKVINQQSPNLSQLEQLQKQIEQFRLDKSGLEGQLNSLRSQVENLEATKNNLQVIEAEFITRQTEFNTLNTKVEELRNQSQELEKKAAELELLRATYDGLFKERETFEIRVNQLRPEIERLEGEKQRILQAIQDNSLEYNRIEEYRQKLADLELQIRDKSALIRTLERNIDRLNGQKAALEENIAQLEQRLKELKGEIEEIENSANIALKSLKEELWNQLPQTQLNFSNETEFLTGFIQYLQSEGLNFSQRVIKAFHTSLKVQDISALVILAGISGTGKSQLPQRYAEYMGAQLENSTKKMIQ
jgi:chromosome segregation ATPase